MKSGRMPIVLSIFLLWLVLPVSILADTTCIDFSLPKKGSIISSPSCTLMVEPLCKNIRKVEFQARYFSSGSDTGTISSLGIITSPPYKLIWDISKIPNQLLSGVSFLAEATMWNGQIYEMKREGVFFTHQEIERPTMRIPYEHSGTKTIKNDSIIFDSPRTPIDITASMYWNEKDITILVEVKDPLFYVNMAQEALLGMGVEILIDPQVNRKPYPQKDVLIYAVPLYGKPYQILYKPEFEKDGSFKLNSITLPCNFNVSVVKEDFKGFKIYFPIPRIDIFPTLPQNIGINLVVKTVKEKNIISRTPWVKGNQFEAYSPFVWGNIEFEPKPLFKNRLLVWGTSFISGLLLTIILQIIMFFLRKSKKQNKFERSESEQKIFNKTKSAIEQKITHKNTNLELVARELRISPKLLNKTVKKITGMSFHNYLMFSRIEIAKERLRSSHCSETSIAEACGFQSANELEKYFVRFNHLTPYKFRMEQQVA